MTMFSKLRNKAKKTRMEMDAREIACSHEVQRVLREFNCIIEPILKADNHSIQAVAQVTALPPKEDEPTKPASPTPPAGGATTGGEEVRPEAPLAAAPAQA